MNILWRRKNRAEVTGMAGAVTVATKVARARNVTVVPKAATLTSAAIATRRPCQVQKLNVYRLAWPSLIFLAMGHIISLTKGFRSHLLAWKILSRNFWQVSWSENSFHEGMP